MGRVARIIGELLSNEWLSNGLPRLAQIGDATFSSGAISNEHLSALDSISPRSGSPVVASEARYRRDCVLAVTRRFFFDAFAQGAKLLLGDPVNLSRNFHDGHGKKLCRKVQMQFVREANMLLERPCH